MDGEHCRDAIQRTRLSPLMPSGLAVRGGEQSRGQQGGVALIVNRFVPGFYNDDHAGSPIVPT
jgi:hypothetical protein